MTEPTRSTPVEGDERVAELQQQVEQLRDDLAALRAALTGEVRTRRLVVEEEDGFERIVAEGHGMYGTLTVSARPVDRERAAERAGEEGGGAVEGDSAEVVLTGDDGSIAPSASVYVRADPDGWGSLGIHGRSAAEGAGPRSRVEINTPHGQAGIEIDSEGLKNAPQRLYWERKAAGAVEMELVSG